MSMYVFKDKLRTIKFYAKDATKENRSTRFYCPNPDCDAHMYICGVDGSSYAYFSANRREYRHVSKCPFDSSNGFNPYEHDENTFDFENALEALTSPSKSISGKETPGSHGTGTPRKKPLRTIRQIYDMCKSFDSIDTYNGVKIGQMIVDDRSEYMYPKGVFGYRLIEGEAIGYFYNSEKLEIKILAPIASRKYSFILKFDEEKLFHDIQKGIYENRDKIIVIAGKWQSTGKFNIFYADITSKRQVSIIK